ncbi:hypothetical protein VC83_09665 [Pseudogymnoascus destructans]|uniref:Uncharacterized protein n=1 Tax=Pseudogymnoascus destructans TaxID=655981 RepID=A0A2P6FGN7_9PEZI|nr:uncharacterized protein VC83_09665 [Pseudogymnoascus destructans]PQM43538.1 hypothetical protein VC83_09665 [Pseudogymnoascus destructans]
MKKETIQGAFRKSGIWPFNCQKALKKMKTYMVPAMAMSMATAIELPCPQTPVRGVQAERSLQEIASKISEKIDIFSSPTRRKIDSTIRGVQNVLLTAEVRDRQYEDLHNRVQNQQKSRIRGNRKGLTKRRGPYRNSGTTDPGKQA